MYATIRMIRWLSILSFTACGASIPTVTAKHSFRQLYPNLKLRTLPLGDSITYGTGSSSGNGYRGDLYTMLTAAGATVDFVGSQKSGNFEKNANEGYPANMIYQISAKADGALLLKPNVVLLLAGTNDHIFGSIVGQNPKTANKRMEALVDKIIKDAPDTVLLVGSLPPLNLTGMYGYLNYFALPVDAYNQQIPIIAKGAVDRGGKVAAVGMDSIGTSDLKDGVHPNDIGYTKMATAWFKAIEDAASKNWIKPLI